VDRRFTALRVIGTIFKILAWLSLIAGLLGAVAALWAGFTLSSQAGFMGLSGPLTGIATFVVALIIAIINFLILYAVGEFIYLFLSIEENMRRTAFFMQQQYTSQHPAYSSPSSSVSDYDD
jgi:hypothetical protein